jgi:hypothetical protein
MTPLAGAPYETMKCLNKYSNGNLTIRWIANTDRYSGTRIFPRDLLWGGNREECENLLRSADVIHIQNQIPNDMLPLISNKRLLAQFHSCPRHPSVDTIMKLTPHCYTISQPMQMKAFHDLPHLPNMMDPEEFVPAKTDNPKPRLVFAPTNDWVSRALGSKGKDDVIPILNRLKNRAEIEIFSNLEYYSNLEIKRGADILIDDVINGTFNKTAIEGCCFGLAVVSGSEGGGWIPSDIYMLEKTLLNLLDGTNLNAAKKHSRDWIMTKYHPRYLTNLYCQAYEKVLQ